MLIDRRIVYYGFEQNNYHSFDISDRKYTVSEIAGICDDEFGEANYCIILNLSDPALGCNHNKSVVELHLNKKINNDDLIIFKLRYLL